MKVSLQQDETLCVKIFMKKRSQIPKFTILQKAEIHGCISTGKEANVYHAMTESGEHRALKVYKTSILVFKVSFV